MIRHAERYSINTMSDALLIPLTQKGQADAYDLGKELCHIAPVNLYHSPVPRCKQTAEKICEGLIQSAHNASVVGTLNDLGGPYIIGNWNEITMMVEHYSQSSFVRKWFNSEIDPSIIMPLPDAARNQLNILIQQLQSQNISTINVTHDWNIMILREYYFNLRHEDIGDPDYLDGLSATMYNDTLHLCYHEHERLINITSL